MRALAAASPRVEVFSIGETEESREMIIVAISDEETIARLDDYKAMLQRLHLRPRRARRPDLRDSYDVIVMGPSSLKALSLLRGVSGPKPIAWKHTELTPNIGVYDETDDMRGALELSGVVNLSTFIKAGGAFVTITSSSSLPIHFGLAEGLQIKDTPTLCARGGVFRTRLSASSRRIAYGYEKELGVYFNS